jgi:hypothetical protein
MQKFVIAAMLVLITVATSVGAMAQAIVYSPPVSAAEAQDIAAANGVIALRKLELDEGKWKIEGRDTAGARVEMKIDRLSGAILELQRYY